MKKKKNGAIACAVLSLIFAAFCITLALLGTFGVVLKNIIAYAITLVLLAVSALSFAWAARIMASEAEDGAKRARAVKITSIITSAAAFISAVLLIIRFIAFVL